MKEIPYGEGALSQSVMLRVLVKLHIVKHAWTACCGGEISLLACFYSPSSPVILFLEIAFQIYVFPLPSSLLVL